MNKEIIEQFGNDPIALCQQWYEDAIELEPNDPDAVSLATATKDGRPSVRWVLIKEISDKGFKFHTNAESRKGRELEENPYAAICFYWKSTRKQIRIEGVVERIPEDEADAYFSTRSTERQIGAWASQQSRPFESLTEMHGQIENYTEKFSGKENIPRPHYWQGYRLIPSSIEFWISNINRLHTRFIYKKDEHGQWSASWLYP